VGETGSFQVTRTLFTVAVALLLLIGCTEDAPPPRVVEVVVDEVVLEPYRPKSRYVGRLQAQDDVTIEARVTGYLLTRDFREGDFIQAGTVLYTLDPSEYKAALARAQADLAAAVPNHPHTGPKLQRAAALPPVLA